ncbi:MAG: hypothetical protein CMJ48_07430, partial [Planctomycetaceae bacterium]|nr:hypothetical protein [Planctomycetaceae bacterium]
MSPNTAELVPEEARGADVPDDALAHVAKVDVNVNELILGRPLQQPIHDVRGVLLLAEGAVITAEFKQLLKSRHLEQVSVHESEVERLTRYGGGSIIDPSTIGLESKLTKELDQAIESGSLSVVNVGDEVRDSLVQHGRKGYDKEYREKVAQEHEQKCAALDDMRQGVLHGSRVDGGEVAQMTESFLSDMVADADNVLTLGNDVRDSLVQHGRRGYDREYRNELVQKHEQKGNTLTDMMKGAVGGTGIDGVRIAQMTGSFLTDMTADADNMLTLAAEACEQEDLSRHCLQMSLLGMAIGVEMGLDTENVRNLSFAGLLHDWGMALVPDKIRFAEGALTDSEFLEIKKHPIYILEMLQKVTGVPSVVPLVCYQVHERINGMGYPRGRNGAAIHLFARILQVADAFVAMTTSRPYRPPLMPYAAMECLVRQAREKLVDARAVRALLQVLSLFPIGSFVTLSDGSVARVIRRNGALYTEPIVQLIQDSQGNPFPQGSDDAIVDISKNSLAVEK